jgi:hypothetical protein
MSEIKVFVSVGITDNENQKAFVAAVEQRLRSENLIPCTVGRNVFTAEAPLKAVVKLMNECKGAIIIATERIYFSSGIEKRGGSDETSLTETKLATSWNQIESAFAYARGLPLLIIVEKGVRADGLLEKGYDWYVQTVDLQESSLNSDVFNGVLSSWKQRVLAKQSNKGRLVPYDDMTLGDLVSNMKIRHLSAVIGAFVAVASVAFSLGAGYIGHYSVPSEHAQSQSATVSHP